MQPIPTEPMHQEKQSCYFWSIAYFLLALAFLGLDIYLALNHNAGLGLVALIFMFISIHQSNVNFEEYKKYQELDNE